MITTVIATDWALRGQQATLIGMALMLVLAFAQLFAPAAGDDAGNDSEDEIIIEPEGLVDWDH